MTDSAQTPEAQPKAPDQPVAVIVLAAGAGTRMKSATQKTLHSIGGRTLLSHSLHAAAGIDPARIVAVIGHGREQVGPAVADVSEQLGREIDTAVQEEQNGTGHAVQCAMKALEGFEGTVVVTNADVPLLSPETLQELTATHDGASVTVLSVNQDNPTGYGRILRTNDGMVTAIVEEKDATEKQKAITEVNSGVFAFDAAILRDGLAQLNTDNAQGELYLTDVLSIARRAGHPVRAHIAADGRNLRASTTEYSWPPPVPSSTAVQWPPPCAEEQRWWIRRLPGSTWMSR